MRARQWHHAADDVGPLRQQRDHAQLLKAGADARLRTNSASRPQTSPASARDRDAVELDRLASQVR